MSLIYVKKFQKGKTLKETAITPLSRYYNKYDSENPYRDYLINEKYDYVNRGNKGLQNLFNVNEKNFPEQAEQRIRNQYDYDRNNYVIEQYAKENNIDLTDRESIMNNLVNAKILSKAMPNSKYAKFIEPSLWARTKGGAVSTANTILNAAGKEGPTFTPDIKGLTPAEEAKYYYPKGVMQKLGNAADTFSVLDIPGAAVMKYATNANQPTTLGDALTGTYTPSTLNAASLPGMVAAPAGLLYGAPDMLSLAGKGLKQAKNAKQEIIYRAIDPVGYGIRDKIKQAPRNLIINSLKPENRPDKIAAVLGKLDDPRIGKNRLDAWRTGLGLDQKYGTFTKKGNTYSIKDFDMGPAEAQRYIADIEAFKAEQSLEGKELNDALKQINKQYDLNTGHPDYAPILNNLKHSSEYKPWGRRRAVEVSKDPNYDYSIYSADNHGIMGAYRMDVKINPDGTYNFKTSDVWDLHPLAKRGEINNTSKLSAADKKFKDAMNKSKFSGKFDNLEFLKLLGGKPFKIENKFDVKRTSYLEGERGTFKPKYNMEDFKYKNQTLNNLDPSFFTKKALYKNNLLGKLENK